MIASALFGGQGPLGSAPQFAGPTGLGGQPIATPGLNIEQFAASQAKQPSAVQRALAGFGASMQRRPGMQFGGFVQAQQPQIDWEALLGDGGNWLGRLGGGF